MTPWERLMSFFTPRKASRSPRDETPMTEGRLAAMAARERAERALQDVRSQAPEIGHVSASLQQIRTENHFGDAVYNAMLRK